MDKDTTQNTTTTPKTLHDTSSTGRERPWRKQKMTSRAVAASMQRIWKKHPRKDIAFKNRSVRMMMC